MDSTAVLVLGSSKSQKLLGVLRGIGLRPQICKTLPDALNRLRRQTLPAAFIDREAVDVDALEFVLNVRDIDLETPVVVIGRSGNVSEDRALLDQPKTYLADRSSAHLGSVIEGLVHAFVIDP